MTQPSKRKNLFVDPKVQSALAIRLTVHWVLFAALLSAISITVKWFSNPFQPLSGLFSGFLHEQWPVLLTMALLLPAFIYDSLKLSNRFAGPIIRFRKTIQSIAETGKPRHLKFRKGDFWHNLANEFNDMLDTFETQNSGTRQSKNAVEEREISKVD